MGRPKLTEAEKIASALAKKEYMRKKYVERKGSPVRIKRTLEETAEAKKEYSKKWNLENKKKRDASRKIWEEENHEKIREKARLRRELNLEKHRERDRKNRKNDGGKSTARMAKYARLHPERMRANLDAYNKQKKLATPKWQSQHDKALIAGLKASAMMLTALTGIAHATDHIVPIQSPYVCGLHVFCNLQILPRETNSAKGNRIWPDMWEPL